MICLLGSVVSFLELVAHSCLHVVQEPVLCSTHWCGPVGCTRQHNVQRMLIPKLVVQLANASSSILYPLLEFLMTCIISFPNRILTRLWSRMIDGHLHLQVPALILRQGLVLRESLLLLLQ